MAKKNEPVQEEPKQEAPKEAQDNVKRNPRQSAPKPTAEDYLNNMNQQQMGMNPTGAVDGFRALSQPIGKEAVQKATQILQKYKEGKANLESRIIENEQWYKLRHWECMRTKNRGKNPSSQVEPNSGWLFNCIANKHADAMDNFPAPNILPREQGDVGEAKMLTDIIPVILDQNDFEKVYSDVWNYKLKTGTGVYGIFWDSSKLNGLGDVSIKKVDILNLFWEPGITDIQKSRHLFCVELVDNEILESQYPQLKNKLGTATINVAKYVYDDTVDTTDKSVVVDWYYKRPSANGLQILHYCKYVNDEVLFSTENDPAFVDRGLYDHARYPFEFDVLFPVEGTPTGFSYIDVGKSAQEYIDRGNQAIMQNMLSNARPRYFIRSDGSVKEAEYADMTRDFVHVDGNLGQDSIIPISGKPLNGIYVNVIDNKIEELKETTGNRDTSTGGTTSGVTAASAIAAMQEASSKLSRDSNKNSYRVFRQICLDVIELIRQFYDLPRCFRILGENGAQQFVMYSNSGIIPQMQGKDFGVDMGMRTPLFDVEVTAEKQSPYSKVAQNELALQLYSAGFFNPQMADQALACLNMMDFDRKDQVMQMVANNANMLQQMMMLAQMVDASTGGTEIMDGLQNQFGIQMPRVENAEVSNPSRVATGIDGGESSVTKNARARVADSTSPDR